MRKSEIKIDNIEQQEKPKDIGSSVVDSHS